MRSRSAELHQWPSHDKYSACVETFEFSNYRCSKYLIGGETIAAERWSTLIFLHVEKDCRALTKFVSTTAYSKDESVHELEVLPPSPESALLSDCTNMSKHQPA